MLDVDALKRELKEWERSFQKENGRLPGKADIKAVPDISLKYAQYKQAKKPVPAVVPTKQAQAPITPIPKRKQRKPAAATSSSLFSKQLPTASPAPISTSNPFSPVKRKAVDPFSDDASPTKPHAVSSSTKQHASPLDDPDNPFGPLSASKSKFTKMPNLFASPSKKKASSSKPKDFLSPETLHSPASSAATTAHAANDFVASDSTYSYANSPKKLRAIIQSASMAIRDTPRTKSRKRMRGEDVPLTPGDKRRRVTGMVKEETPMVEEDEDDGEIELSPSKPIASAQNGKLFQPLLDDDPPTVAPKGPPISKPLFFVGTARPAGPSKLLAKAPTTKRPPPNVSTRRSVSTGTEDWTTESGSTPADSDDDRMPPPVGKGRAFGKRTIAEVNGEDPDIVMHDSPPPSAGPSSKLPATMANPFGLRPPSPILRKTTAAANKYKGKGKWNERKKNKVEPSAPVEGATSEVEEEHDEEEAMVVKDLEWTSWGSLRPSAPRPDPGDAISVDDPADRYRTKAIQPKSSVIDSPSKQGEEVEDLQVDLPDEMRRVLQIGSPLKQRRRADDDGEVIMRGLMKGAALPPEKLKGVEVWGSGQLEDGSEDEDEEKEWDSEPEGWTGTVEM